MCKIKSPTCDFECSFTFQKGSLTRNMIMQKHSFRYGLVDISSNQGSILQNCTITQYVFKYKRVKAAALQILYKKLGC